MARISRQELIDEFNVGAYHCTQRCVRRAFLCGDDPLTGINYDHRKVQIEERMEFLAGQMAVEFLGFSVMDNHLHLILRNRPDVVPTWSDEEVARRWWYLCPGRKDKEGRPVEPEQADLDEILADPTRILVLRGRLSSISWLMRFLAEKVARQANKEDGCTGRFWQGRYGCQRLLDEKSLLACSLYVDLNPIRAGIAETPETSEFTAAYKRIQALRAAAEAKSESDGEAGEQRPEPGDGWLSPIYIDPEHDQRLDEQPRRRATNYGFLPMTLDEYLELLDYAGRQVRSDKRGAIPAEYQPILERLGITSEHWIDAVQHFGRLFHRAAGAPEQMDAEAERHGRQWLAGVSGCRAAFG